MSHEHPFNGASFVVQIEGEEEEGFGLFFLLDCRKEKEGMLGTDGGVFPFFFAWGSLFPFGGWVGEMGWGLPSLPPRSEPIFFPFWCLINNKREERDLHCAVVQLSIRFVLFSFRDLLEDVLFETLGFMGTPRPFEPLSWALCPFLGSLKGETKTIPLWHLGKEKQKQKKQRLFFKGAVFCFVDLSFGAKKKELCNDTTDQCLFFIHARYDNAETGRKQRIGWLN